MNKKQAAIKILFIAPPMLGGGAERLLTVLLKHMDRDRITPLLVLIQKRGVFLSQVVKDVRVIDLGANRVRYALSKIIGIVRQEKPDVVFSTFVHVNIMVILARFFIPRRIRYIARETNIPSFNMKQSPFRYVLPLLYRILYPRFDRVIYPSNDMLDDLTSHFGFPRSKGVVINNPVDIKGIGEQTNNTKRNFNDKKFNILAAGKLKYQKGFDLLLQSMAYIEEKDFHLTILGQGPEENALKGIARDLNLVEDVTFAGFVENPYSYMVDADLFVLSSRFEGFPNVVLEAMACGIPVVAFDCPGGINEIIENGINGLRVEPGNVKAFAKGIETARRTKWNREEIRNFINNKFGVKRIVAEYEEMFFGVMKRGGKL